MLVFGSQEIPPTLALPKLCIETNLAVLSCWTATFSLTLTVSCWTIEVTVITPAILHSPRILSVEPLGPIQLAFVGNRTAGLYHFNP